MKDIEKTKPGKLGKGSRATCICAGNEGRDRKNAGPVLKGLRGSYSPLKFEWF